MSSGYLRGCGQVAAGGWRHRRARRKVRALDRDPAPRAGARLRRLVAESPHGHRPRPPDPARRRPPVPRLCLRHPRRHRDLAPLGGRSGDRRSRELAGHRCDGPPRLHDLHDHDGPAAQGGRPGPRPRPGNTHNPGSAPPSSGARPGHGDRAGRARRSSVPGPCPPVGEGLALRTVARFLAYAVPGVTIGRLSPTSRVRGRP